MPATSPYTIILDNRDWYAQDERVVAADNTIYPGHLVGINSSNLAILHATAADAAIIARFARENELIGRDIDTAYAAGETCYFLYPRRGARIYAWLETGANVAIDAPLEANGAGALQANTTGQIVGWAIEAVNNSGGGTGPDGAARIRIRVA